MSQQIDGANLTLTVTAAIALHLRVTAAGALAGAEDLDLGTATRASFASGDEIAVRHRGAEGTTKMVAAGAVTANTWVYGAASGKVSATINGNPIGIALEAATADGDVIEVLRLERGAMPQGFKVSTKTADFDVENTDAGTLFDSTGATGAVTATLPAALAGVGPFMFRVGAAQELRLDPDGTETIALPSTGVQQAAGKYITANAAGETVVIACVVAGQWEVLSSVGTWTAEA